MKKYLFLYVMLLSFNSFADDSFSDDPGHILRLGYDLSGTARFSKDSDTLDINFESGFSVGYEYFNAPKNSWGSSFGITYFHDKKATSKTLNSTTLGLDTEENVSMMSVHFNLVSRWEKFYIPFGLSYSAVNYNAPGNTLTYTSEGGIGFNLYFGWMINDQFAVEYGVTSSKWDLVFQASGVDVLFSGAYAVNSLNLKYRF